MITGADPQGTHRAVERHAFQGLDERLVVDLSRLFEPFCDELGRHIPIEGADPRIPVIGLPELIDEGPVRRRVRVIEEVVRSPESAFRRVGCPAP